MQHTHTSTYVTHIYTQQPHTVPMHVYCTDTTHTHKWPQIIPPAYAPVLLPTVHTYYIHVDIHTTSILITHTHKHIYFMGRPRCLSGKESTCQAGDPAPIPGSGRLPGEGNGNSLQYSPGKSRGHRSLGGTVHSVAKSGNWLSGIDSGYSSPLKVESIDQHITFPGSMLEI